jgi:hypothetical protein
MMYRGKRENLELEFIGASPRNSAIASSVRANGYMAMMMNSRDMMDAVVWASNLVHSYTGFFSSGILKTKVVLPLGELPFSKDDVVNAHFVLLSYYGMKKNFALIEPLKQSLYTVARFQEMGKDNARAVEKDEKKYARYSALVTAEIEHFREECARFKA